MTEIFEFSEYGKEATAWLDFFLRFFSFFPSATPFLIISFEVLLFLPLFGKIIESVFTGMCGRQLSVQMITT